MCPGFPLTGMYYFLKNDNNYYDFIFSIATRICSNPKGTS